MSTVKMKFEKEVTKSDTVYFCRIDGYEYDLAMIVIDFGIPRLVQMDFDNLLDSSQLREIADYMDTL
jgi:hypothetical protein